MAVAVRIVLALGLLLAHTPVCKVAALSPRTQPDSPRAAELPPCCGKCAKKADTQTPKPRPPAKPACPTGTECPLCGAPAAVVVPAAVGMTHFAAPTIARLAESARVLAAAGFHTLLDRPPRG